MSFKSEILSEIIKSRTIESDDEFLESKIYHCSENIIRERYDILTDKQSEFYNKDIGRYEIFSTPNPLDFVNNDKKILIESIIIVMREILGKITAKSRILIVGLGNRHIKADSLGTEICKRINITFPNKKLPYVMAICPSVMGLTGIETYDIVKGVIDRVNPTHLILIDSLCASDESRLCKSIQITNTGVCPGSGIGNNRKCIDRSVAPIVISIGVPLLIYASTFIDSILSKYNISLTRINTIMQSTKKSPENVEIFNIINDIKSVLKNYNSDTIVSIKDIEECVTILAEIISDSINISLNVSELK